MNQTNISSRRQSPDMSAFVSRLQLKGSLLFETAHRIGAERSLAVDAPDLPVLRTADGRPYIPGSSFKGAWRAYTEATLRAIQEQTGIDDNLACLSVSKPQRYDNHNPKPKRGYCLTQNDVKVMKQMDKYKKNRALLDKDLRALSCWACRVFGSSWLAAKLLVKDLPVDPDTFWRTEVRDGVGIDRDSGRAGDKLKYQFEVTPPPASFAVEIIAENASTAELGLAMLGLEAFRRGEILLGGAKSRGLGWCRLEPDWDSSSYIHEQNLLGYLLGQRDEASRQKWRMDEKLPRQWLDDFLAEIRQAKATEEE